MKFYSLNEVIDEHIGPIGTPKRDAFENKLRLDLLGKAIKGARLQRNLTQQRLGNWWACKKRRFPSWKTA